jgi:hypothetical protein
VISDEEKSENGREKVPAPQKSNRIPNRWRRITQPGPHMRQIQSHGLYMGPNNKKEYKREKVEVSILDS